MQLKLDAASNGAAPSGSGDPTPLKSAIRMCGSLTEEVRSMSYHLYPPSLHELGLCAALRQMAFDFGPGPTLEVKWPDSLERVRLPVDVDIALFRIAQEAVTNAMRHSGCHTVHLTLDREDGDLVLAVTDEGIGFDVESAAMVGLGLRIMRERATSVGAELTVESQPGRTCMTARVAVGHDAFG
ncbi:MAG: sensor histidine kinase [Planctomycetota bacterium]